MRKFMRPGGHGYDRLVAEVADSTIPNKPAVTYLGRAGFPLEDLRFRSSGFIDATGTFAAMKWRIGEVSDLSAPNHVAGRVQPYEINALWEAESVVFTADVLVPPSTLRAGSTYRVRVKHIFTGDPGADLDLDGASALLEHALGGSDQIAGPSPITTSLLVIGAFQFSFPWNLGADDVVSEIQLSENLLDWAAAGDAAVLSEAVYDGSGIQFETWTVAAPATARHFVRLLVRQR
jgi:hypothetical protein